MSEITLYTLKDFLSREDLIEIITEYYPDYGWMTLGKSITKKELRKDYGEEFFNHPNSNIEKGRLKPNEVYWYDTSSLYTSDWCFRKIDFDAFLKEQGDSLSLDYDNLEDIFDWLNIKEEEQNAIKLLFEIGEE